MFNLSEQVRRLQQLKHAKIHGLPLVKYCQKCPPIGNIGLKQVNHCIFDTQAKQENEAISRSFRNRSADFGRRLSKVKGEKHHPGGGYAGHIERI